MKEPIFEIEVKEYNRISIALLGAIAHPAYYIWWTFIDPQEHENFYIRIVGVVSCALLYFVNYWPKSCEKYFNIYWFFAIMYNCPFFFSVYLINSGFSAVWTAAIFCAIYLTIMMMQHYMLFIINYIMGTIFAILFCYLINGYFVVPTQEYFLFTYLPIFVFAIVTGFIFHCNDRRGNMAQEKAKIYKSLAGSIAHEIRNPLNTINIAGNQINSILKDLENDLSESVKENLKDNKPK